VASISLVEGSGFSSPNLNVADWTPVERADVQVVNDFCTAWPGHDLPKVLSFFSGDAVYRMSERREPAKGHQAVSDKINGFLHKVVRFEVLDTFARGPMVFNDRIDRISVIGPPIRQLRRRGRTSLHLSSSRCMRSAREG
jgi:limonene-1,2-epoxide hydrolase